MYFRQNKNILHIPPFPWGNKEKKKKREKRGIQKKGKKYIDSFKVKFLSWIFLYSLLRNV